MDVFISYSRKNGALCKKIYALLTKRLGLSVFVDEHIAGGDRWEATLLEQLSPKNSLYVLLLATQEAVGSTWVQKELKLARDNQIKIVPLEFDDGAAAALLGGSEIQTIPANRHGTNDAQLESRLRVALCQGKFEIALQQRSESTHVWIHDLTRATSFWQLLHGGFAQQLTASGGLVLLGPGGAGKSTLASLIVRALERGGATAQLAGGGERVYPILLHEADLLDGGAELATALGSPSIEELEQRLQIHRLRHRLRVVFVLDGLDQWAPNKGQSYRDYAIALGRLTRCATSLVTCRPEVWNEAYRKYVSLDVETVAELADATVADVLDAEFPDRAVHVTELLRRPLFLDLTLRYARSWREVPENDVEFLSQLWTTLSRDDRASRVGADLPKWKVLEELATRQVEARHMAVDREKLERSLGPGARPTIDRLVRERFICQTGGASKQVRLVHDLLDAFNIARRLLGTPEPVRRKFYDGMDEDGMSSVVAMLAAVAETHGSPGIVDEVFDYFLWVLDRKRHSSLYMGRSWAATYALQERFDVFLPSILRCFETDQIAPSLHPDSAATGSSMDPPLLTQEAASTLASAFQSHLAGRSRDAARVVPRLVGKLGTWKYRARLVEAIAKYDSNESRDALLRFATQCLEDGSDNEALEYTVRALRAFDDPRVLTFLRNVLTNESASSRLRRISAESLDWLRPGSIAVPSRTDADLVAELRPFAVDEHGNRLPGYSDWQLVEQAAFEVERRILRAEPLSDSVIYALIGAMDHDQTAVRCPVARCLGYLNHPLATDALIEELIEPDVSAEVRNACIGAIRATLSRFGGTKRQAVRVAMIRAALRAKRCGADLGSGVLVDLAFDPAWEGDPPIDMGAAALTVAPSGKQGFELVLDRITVAPDADLAEIPRADELEAAGPEHERKWRFAAMHADGNRLSLSLAPSSWQLGRSFHRIAHEAPDRIPRVDADGFRLPEPLGSSQVPGLAVVHVIVTTQDGKLLAAQRSATVSYAPLHWSLSFEEQVTGTPDGLPENPIAAAMRGFREEFGVELYPSSAVVLSPIIEMDSLNVAGVIWLRVPVSAKELRRSWEGPPRPSHHHEAAEISFLDGSRANLQRLLVGEGSPIPLHPTSRLRLILLEEAMSAI